MISFRRMTPADQPALMAIASRICDGTSYLPAVFDAWVADPEGEFTAVLLNGRLIGCAKLSFLTPRDAWFEGLRKDPDVTAKGIATAVSTVPGRALAGRADLASIRFSTDVKNLASITANERMGFVRCLTLSCKVWSRKPHGARGAPRRGGGGRGLPFAGSRTPPWRPRSWKATGTLMQPTGSCPTDGAPCRTRGSCSHRGT